MTIEFLGLYPVQKNVHLIECMVRGTPDEVVRIGDFTQPLPGVKRSSWQVAYDEYLLNRSGTDGFDIFEPQGIRIEMDLRMAFFMHFLDLRLPILSPVGELRLPSETPMPERLKFLKYQKTD
jgi:hypothetical protein